VPRVPAARIRVVNDAPVKTNGEHVLYWLTAFRRLRSNFALQHAIETARTLDRPLIILEALRVDYPWASDRLHRFVIDGMAEHAASLARAPAAYFPYVESARGAARGLLAALAARACLVVADDYPCFFLPRMLAAAAARLDVRIEAVDANGVLPMRLADKTFVTARAFRAHLQRSFRDAIREWPGDIDFRGLRRAMIAATIRRRWRPASLETLRRPERLIARLPIDHTVGATRTRGGSIEAARRLRAFVRDRLDGYADDQPYPNARGSSGLSPYLHFGHISAHEIFEAVMSHERWTSRQLAPATSGAREGWWGVRPGSEAFLEQLLTWRELGLNMCVTKPNDYDRFEALPAWARRTLATHQRDRRRWIYPTEALAAGNTHDPLWNAAARQLAEEGWMPNYLRMLWGKKILEWSPTPKAALETMTAIMDRFALDGRDPNSYSGYAWVLGRYDRPWGPERPIFGTVRYMSSESARRKGFIPL
jgi:deoxyribodipyrimidine photo-lyase